MNPFSSDFVREQKERYSLRKMAGFSGGGVGAPLPIRRPTPVRSVPAVECDPRPQAASREPCPYCSTRGDLGCDHFAPCSPSDLPREGRGVMNESKALVGDGLGGAHV